MLFGALHLLNPNATVVSALAIALSAGLVLGAGYMLTRRLWLPTGAHFAWNFTLGGVFGLAISGKEAPGLLRAELSPEPETLTGGAFGPEASLFVMLIGLAIGFVFIVVAMRWDRIRRPVWARPREAPSCRKQSGEIRCVGSP